MTSSAVIDFTLRASQHACIQPTNWLTDTFACCNVASNSNGEVAFLEVQRSYLPTESIIQRHKSICLIVLYSLIVVKEVRDVTRSICSGSYLDTLRRRIISLCLYCPGLHGAKIRN